MASDTISRCICAVETFHSHSCGPPRRAKFERNSRINNNFSKQFNWMAKRWTVQRKRMAKLYLNDDVDVQNILGWFGRDADRNDHRSKTAEMIYFAFDFDWIQLFVFGFDGSYVSVGALRQCSLFCQFDFNREIARCPNMANQRPKPNKKTWKFIFNCRWLSHCLGFQPDANFLFVSNNIFPSMPMHNRQVDGRENAERLRWGLGDCLLLVLGRMRALMFRE